MCVKRNKLLAKAVSTMIIFILILSPMTAAASETTDNTEKTTAESSQAIDTQETVVQTADTQESDTETEEDLLSKETSETVGSDNTQNNTQNNTIDTGIFDTYLDGTIGEQTIGAISELFADTKLAEAIADELLIDTNSGVSESQLESITSLSLPGSNISSLEGIQYLTNIEYLDLNNNQITDISLLSDLLNLKTLMLNTNSIADISAITDLVNLTYLDISYNQVADISPISKLTRLAYINLDNNQIRDITPIWNLICLEWYSALNQTIYLTSVESDNDTLTISNIITGFSMPVESGIVKNTIITPSGTGTYNSKTDEITFTGLSDAGNAIFTFSDIIKYDGVEYTFSGTVIQPYTISDITGFIARLYKTILGRTPDTAGLNTWTKGLKEGTLTGADVVYSIYNSTEYKNKKTSNTDFVESVYISMLNRKSDAAGKANWIAYLEEGFSRTFVLKRFADSTEFANLCKTYNIAKGTINVTEYRDMNVNVTRYVQRLYSKCLGRTADTEGLNNWTKWLITGQKTGASVVLAFYYSDEYKNKNISNADFVASLYNSMMNRNPDAAGKAFWVSYLSNNYSRRFVISGFAQSIEFTNICQIYGITRGSITTSASDKPTGQ